ncbi:hypothetical protein A8C32_02840 [Flavivirga aquatica]|uniref:DUF3822 domain-containing protein n=1 Tax=Flavivirga aquatica TaxID=1849968 RepID=A0A1E5TAJ4_9FLAO|nr:DUF3822 family protein [Flavivirga aquatica]OEK08402.1 hypothetical protein A8C32_02840 [Flavivirga aquatica]
MALPKNNISSNDELTNIELSIQISLSGLSFCILDRYLNTITTLKDIFFDKRLNPLEVLDHLKLQFENENILENLSFSNVCVIHDNDLSTLIPTPLFDENCLADYLKFNSKILKSDFITYDSILLNDSVNVYVPYININNFIYDQFGSFTFKHVSTVLISEILNIEKNADTTKVYVNVSKTHFEIIIVKKSKLLLYNSFIYNTKEDFIYYILFTIEQLKLNPEILDLVFIGDITNDSEVYSITYKYIRNISFGNRHDVFKFNESPSTNHSNFTLIKSF